MPWKGKADEEEGAECQVRNEVGLEISALAQLSLTLQSVWLRTSHSAEHSTGQHSTAQDSTVQDST